MKKIPTLFHRIFDEKHNKTITRELTPGLEWVLAGDGIATLKVDGSCCCIRDGVFYKRYDAKQGKKPPENAIPCCDPDPITGHWPYWVPVTDTPENRWYLEAYKCTEIKNDETYEAIGPHFRSNPYSLSSDVLVPHGAVVQADIPRNFDGLRDFLSNHAVEGIVFWKDGEPRCKIKRSDFGFKWPSEGASPFSF